MKKITILIFVFLLLTSNSLAQEEKYELKSIDFEGNDAFSKNTLSYIIRSEETPWWFWKFLDSFTSLGKAPVYFDSTNIQIDVKSIKDYYTAHGYFSSKVTSDYEIDFSNKTAELTFFIDEGEPSTYNRVNIFGIEKTPDLVKEKIKADLSFDTTKQYDQIEVLHGISKGLNTLLNNGYLFATFDSTIIIQDTISHKADLDIFYSTGTLYILDTVKVKLSGPGADKVEEHLIRDLIELKAGHHYDYEKIKNGQDRLLRTGLFNFLNLGASENDTIGNHVPLVLNGNIGYLNELAPELIINNQQNAFNVGLGASYIKKNFFGHARKLTVSSTVGLQDFFNIDFGRLFKKFSFRDTTLLGYFDSKIIVEQPYLFGRKIFGRWETSVKIDKQRNFNVTTYASKIGFEFEMPRYTVINFLSTFYSIESSNELYKTKNDSLASKITSLIGLNIGSTTVDSILFPTRGYNISLSLEEANFLPYAISQLSGSNFDEPLFYKVVITASQYLSLSERRNSIFASKLKFGFINVYKGDFSGIALNKTFYAGGSNSLRGWRAGELPGTDRQGGKLILEGSIEFRKRFLNYFGAVLFADYGNTFKSLDEIATKNIAVAAGFGFRYYSIVAPFRIDFGFKFYNPVDKKFIFDKKFWQNFEFHFGIGEAF